MLHLLRAGALALACCLVSSAAIGQSGPPRTTTLADGTRKETTPAATYCSADNGATWAPCSIANGSGTDPRVAQGSATSGQTGILTQGAVVTGDQAWTAGETRPYTLTPTGRLKVGLSSAGNVEPGAQLGTTIAADLVACKYRTAVTWTTGWTGSLGCDASGNLNINNATLSPGASTEATLAGISGKLPATLGQKTQANSLAVTLASDGTYATAANQQTMIANAPALATAGSAAPTTGTQAMGTDGTSARALLTGPGGALLIGTSGSSGTAVVMNGSSDGLVAGTLGLFANARSYVFNGTTFDRMRGDTNGTYVVGGVATGTTDAGNPVKIGGLANTVQAQRATAGQRVDLWMSPSGAAMVGQVNAGMASDSVNGVGFLPLVDSGTASAPLATGGFVYSGSAFVRQRGDTNGTFVVGKGGVNLATAQVSVGTTATQLAAARTGRQKIIVSIGAANACSLGTSAVTTTSGFALQPTAGASLTLDTAAALFAVCSATTTISVLEQY